jgi:hypothetical protein
MDASRVGDCGHLASVRNRSGILDRVSATSLLAESYLPPTYCRMELFNIDQGVSQ